MSAGRGRFYVYKFVRDGEVVYVGKGTGRRLEHQERRFGFAGEIVRHFRVEKHAYDYEAKLIEKLKPVENKCAGGGGSITRKKANPPVPYWYTKRVAEMNRVGSRVYVARELLKFDLSGRVPPEKIAMLRAVAAGHC